MSERVLIGIQLTERSRRQRRIGALASSVGSDHPTWVAQSPAATLREHIGIVSALLDAVTEDDIDSASGG